jgi:hypothetical protein
MEKSLTRDDERAELADVEDFSIESDPDDDPDAPIPYRLSSERPTVRP